MTQPENQIMRPARWQKFVLPVIIVVVIYCIYCCFFRQLPITHFILVRHAEKTGNNLNDPLSPKGFQRADSLAYYLSQSTADGIYATQYLRTQQTVQPAAAIHGLTVIQYPASGTASDIEAFVDQLFADHRGKTVIVSGHTNTLPLIANEILGSNQLATIADHQYDNMLVISALRKGRAKLLHLKYGFQNP
jgi:broad specificity phosphatase PhoE